MPEPLSFGAPERYAEREAAMGGDIRAQRMDRAAEKTFPVKTARSKRTRSLRWKRMDSVAGAALSITILSGAGCTHRPVGGGMRGWPMMGTGGYGGMFMWLIIIIAVAVAIYLVLNRNSGIGRKVAGTGERPLEILKRRYAEGEISREDFERMKRDLTEPR